MPTWLFITIFLIAALNLRLIIPVVRAYFGHWQPPSEDLSVLPEHRLT